MSTAPSTLERVELRTDLDKAAPCHVAGCDNEAAWRLTHVHFKGAACQSFLICHQHHKGIKGYEAWVWATGQQWRCHPHERVLKFRWAPL